MKKCTFLKATAVILTASTGAAAQSPTSIEVMGGRFDVSAFEPTQAYVAVAMDKQTGRKFNVVKLSNNKMMVLMSVDRMKAITPFSDDSEMMYSGHPGSTR